MMQEKEKCSDLQIAEAIERLYYPAWLKAVEELTEDFTKQCGKDFARITGATWNSPLAMMFTGFCMGMIKGCEIAEYIHRGEKRNDTSRKSKGNPQEEQREKSRRIG